MGSVYDKEDLDTGLCKKEDEKRVGSNVNKFTDFTEYMKGFNNNWFDDVSKECKEDWFF